MKPKKCFLLLFASIVFHGMAQEQNNLVQSDYEGSKNNIQSNVQETDENNIKKSGEHKKEWILSQ